MALEIGVLSRTRRRWTPGLVLGIGLVLAMSACGGDDSGGSNESSGGGTTLNAMLGEEPPNLEPLLDERPSQFMYSVYEGLVKRVPGDSEIEPAVASEWEQDGNAWVFTLRDGVTFHNGDPVTAEDVVASWDRILDPEKSLLLGNYVLEDTKVEALDEMTVSISRPVPDPTLLTRAAGIVIVPAEYADISDSRLDTEMVGTGPYKFVEWNRGQELTLEANEDYWGEVPDIKNITLQFTAEPSVRLDALQAGEVQLAANMAADLVNDSFTAEATPSSEVLTIRLNNLHGAFMDERLRKAANMAIDRETIYEAIYGGFAESAGGQLVANYVFGHNASLEDYPFDVDGAKALLSEADGVGTEIELWGTNGLYPNDAAAAKALAAMLEDVGFKVDLKIPPLEDWLDAAFIAGTDDTKAPDALVANFSAQLFDSAPNLGQNVLCDGGASTICQSDLDDLAAQALEETDVAARQSLYDEIWAELYDQAAFVSVGEVTRLTFLDKSLSWTPTPDGFFRFQDMSFNGDA
jgi:peptide/nickel transport system substrate-binding protein